MYCSVKRILLASFAALLGVACKSGAPETPMDSTLESVAGNASEATRMVERITPDEDELGRGGGPTHGSYDEARDHIAEERCAKLDACGSIHQGSAYTTHDGCIEGERVRIDGWWANACSEVSLDAMNRCLAEAAGDECRPVADRAYAPSAGACAPQSVCGPDRP